MTASQGNRAITTLFSEPLVRDGFTSTEACIFQRIVADDVAQRLAFGGRIAADRSFCFTILVGVRFHSLEHLLNPDTDTPTVVMPIHLLRPDTGYSEWQLTDSDNGSAVRAEVLSHITSYALPFLNRNSTIASVKERLRSESPRDWYILTSVSRLRLLIAIEFIEGRRAEAIQQLDAVIAERRAKLPKDWLPFATLRRRFEEVLTA